MWDIFISHAFEDKGTVAKPLASRLRETGLTVWYDEFTLRIGDSLNEKISHGLSNSRYGLVILSPNFFNKKWTNYELNALFSLETIKDKKILPVWHNVSRDDVALYNPTLADRVAISTANGLNAVFDAIIEHFEIENFKKKEKDNINNPLNNNDQRRNQRKSFDSEWGKTVRKYVKKELTYENSGIWGDIIDRPELFHGLKKNIVGLYLDALRYQDYMLSWNDNDKDLGVFDNPDIIVVEETVNFLKDVVSEIPSDKLKTVFNWIINSASCGRGWGIEHVVREKMKQRIRKCFSACVEFKYDGDKIAKHKDGKNLWNEPEWNRHDPRWNRSSI